MPITIELPADIERNLESSRTELERAAREAIVAEGYRRGLLSWGQVEQMLGSSYWEAQAFLQQHNAYPPYRQEDYDEDLKTLDRLCQPFDITHRDRLHRVTEVTRNGC